ncbi:hypothetical protein [Haloarcula pellucida]|uniref:Uncharacterized protein n=1 Tax=Haloarcula pellucida TaxID=1427151 RepID=A0A830GR44_9EURY|nr:hypothetical protein [Halomicroarcula pellucida]MBX0350531.1 hypothetical protein [Halomicroarcula pellucida]GGO03755.1 hypothetical protein GCM10009030_39760 [Halomicroarcula pellucida]
MSDHEWDVFADESPTEIHHEDCQQTPASYPTGDANETGVINAPQHAVDDDERFDRSCECLDPLLGDDRDRTPPLPPLHVGDHVEDRKDTEAAMVVVGKQLGAADDYDVDGWGTVADYNQDYPSDDDVIEVTFPDRTTADIDAPDRYAYPRSRLALVSPVHDLEDEEGEN